MRPAQSWQKAAIEQFRSRDRRVLLQIDPFIETSPAPVSDERLHIAPRVEGRVRSAINYKRYIRIYWGNRVKTGKIAMINPR